MTELFTVVLIAAAVVPTWLLGRLTYRLYLNQHINHR
jgi:hypothetical protein